MMVPLIIKRLLSKPPPEIRPVSYMDWKPRNHDLSEEEEHDFAEGMMTRWNDGWDRDDWEDLQDAVGDYVAPIAGVVVILGICFLVWKFGYLLS